MSLQTRNVPVEEVQKIQKSLWRQSSAVKDAIRDAAGRVLDHVRSRETLLVEQVGLVVVFFACVLFSGRSVHQSILLFNLTQKNFVQLLFPFTSLGRSPRARQI